MAMPPTRNIYNFFVYFYKRRKFLTAHIAGEPSSMLRVSQKIIFPHEPTKCFEDGTGTEKTRRFMLT